MGGRRNYASLRKRTGNVFTFYKIQLGQFSGTPKGRSCLTIGKHGTHAGGSIRPYNLLAKAITGSNSFHFQTSYFGDLQGKRIISDWLLKLLELHQIIRCGSVYLRFRHKNKQLYTVKAKAIHLQDIKTAVRPLAVLTRWGRCKQILQKNRYRDQRIKEGRCRKKWCKKLKTKCLHWHRDFLIILLAQIFGHRHCFVRLSSP